MLQIAQLHAHCDLGADCCAVLTPAGGTQAWQACKAKQSPWQHDVM